MTGLPVREDVFSVVREYDPLDRCRGTSDGPFSYPALVDLAARDRMLAGLAAFASDRFNATGEDQPEQLPGLRVSASFFDVLGVPVAAGRAFVLSDDERGAPRLLLVLSPT